eukprot:SAG31_NODE_886_length_11229_cov_19.134142_7_plen_186_part_00
MDSGGAADQKDRLGPSLCFVQLGALPTLSDLRRPSVEHWCQQLPWLLHGDHGCRSCWHSSTSRRISMRRRGPAHPPVTRRTPGANLQPLKLRPFLRFEHSGLSADCRLMRREVIGAAQLRENQAGAPETGSAPMHDSQPARAVVETLRSGRAFGGGGGATGWRQPGHRRRGAQRGVARSIAAALP